MTTRRRIKVSAPRMMLKACDAGNAPRRQCFPAGVALKSGMLDEAAGQGLPLQGAGACERDPRLGLQSLTLMHSAGLGQER